MSTKTLVLEVSWAWDHAHNEFASISLEEHADLSLLGDILETGIPNKDLYDRLRELYFKLDRTIMGKGQMVALYLQEQETRRNLTKKGMSKLTWRLKQLCRFNLDNEPIPLR